MLKQCYTSVFGVFFGLGTYCYFSLKVNYLGYGFIIAILKYIKCSKYFF